MIEPRRLRVTYRIEPRDGDPFVMVLQLDAAGRLEPLRDDGPAWTRVDGDRCAGCDHGGTHCPAALSIVPVVEAFKEIDSLQTARTCVTIGERTTEVTGPVSHVVASLIGLCMPASGCPAAAPFRAMAVYHQPFATLEETAIRAAGFALLERWALGTLHHEQPFASLIDAWSGLESVNQRIGRRLRDFIEQDAALNGLSNLDMFAKFGGFGLESALDALKPALLARLDVQTQD